MNIVTERQRIEQFNDLMHDCVSKEFQQWLIDNGFFTSPASTRFHGNYLGGLYDHSEAVTTSLVEMTAKLDSKWQRKESPWIVGMFHDLCKIDQYEKVVDVDVEGKVLFGSDEVKGEEVHFEHSNDGLLDGHGEKSIILLSQFMTLTEEEILCIRYHMGAYNKEDWNGYDRAIRKYPNVLFTHTADMYASKVLEN